MIDPEVPEDKMIKKIHQLTGMTLQELDANDIKVVKSSLMSGLKKETIVDVAPHLVKYNNDNSTKITEPVKKKQKRSEYDSNDNQNDLPGVNDYKKNVESSKMNNRKKNIKEYSNTKNHYRTNNVPIIESIKYKFDPQFSLESFKKYTTKVYISKMDTVDRALDLKYNESLNPLVLNMANAKTPGGGVAWGALAQEESIFYRSNYHLHLDPERKKQESLYPISDLEAIYSTGVDISRDSDWNFIETSKDLDFIASAAIQKPKLNNKVYLKEDRKLMLNKIELMFQVGLKTNHDTLLLSAFGCGAFGNPPDVVANLFVEMIKKYNGCFNRIEFAIIPPLYPPGSNNFEVFKTIFKKSSLLEE